MQLKAPDQQTAKILGDDELIKHMISDTWLLLKLLFPLEA